MQLTINLSPTRADYETTASLSGTVLTINGVDYDLALLPDGAIADHPDLGRVTRIGDVYECTIRLTHGASAPEATRFPQPIVLIDHAGPIELPAYDETSEVTNDVA